MKLNICNVWKDISNSCVDEQSRKHFGGQTGHRHKSKRILTWKHEHMKEEPSSERVFREDKPSDQAEAAYSDSKESSVTAAAPCPAGVGVAERSSATVLVALGRESAGE